VPMSAGDILAGVIVAGTSLPQYIAYATLSGVAGHRGVQTAGPPQMAFALITGSPTLCVSVTSITALMASGTLRGPEYKESFGEEALVDMLSTFAVMVGIASLLLAVLGAGKLAAYIPSPVKIGWKTGLAVTTTASQFVAAVYATGSKEAKRLCRVPQMLPGGAASMYRLGWILSHPWTWSFLTVLFAVATYWQVRHGNKIMRKLSKDRLQVPGLEVVVATLLGTLLTVSIGYAGDVVGQPPQPTEELNEPIAEWSLQALVFGWVRSWPWTMAWEQTVEQLGGWMSACISAIGFAAVDFLAIVSIQAEMAPSGDWNTARELAGQGIASIVSGIAGGGPVGGSLSRSMVAKMTGASSPIMGFVCGLTTMAFTVHAAAVFLAPIPQAVLAAIVLAAVLPSVLHPKDLIKLGGKDAAVGWLTASSSVLVDPMTGFIFGTAVYVLLHVRPNKAGPVQTQRSGNARTFRQAANTVIAANRFAAVGKRSRIVPLPAHHFEHVKIDC